LTLYRKSVVLRDFNIHKDLHSIALKEGLEAAYKQLDNNESYATFIDSSKESINNQLAELNITSDRVRRLNDIPKYRIINSKKERIQ
jgi:hypothetical protein